MRSRAQLRKVGGANGLGAELVMEVSYEMALVADAHGQSVLVNNAEEDGFVGTDGATSQFSGELRH